jgi:hypothetical protein
MRLAELAPATDLKDDLGQPVTLPAQLKLWRARISFSTTKPDSIGGCQVRLQDTKGATYTLDSKLEFQYNIPFSAGCLADSLAATPPPTFDTEQYFLLPRTAQPAAIWITLVTQEPRYARLIAP